MAGPGLDGFGSAAPGGLSRFRGARALAAPARGRKAYCARSGLSPRPLGIEGWARCHWIRLGQRYEGACVPPGSAAQPRRQAARNVAVIERPALCQHISAPLWDRRLWAVSLDSARSPEEAPPGGPGLSRSARAVGGAQRRGVRAHVAPRPFWLEGWGWSRWIRLGAPGKRL